MLASSLPLTKKKFPLFKSKMDKKYDHNTLDDFERTPIYAAGGKIDSLQIIFNYKINSLSINPLVQHGILKFSPYLATRQIVE